MRNFILLILLFSFSFAFSQNTEFIQKEINQNLWKPFKAAFENIDGKALNSLYAKQVLRVTPSGIDTENEFKLANLKRFDNYGTLQTKIELDFWFDSRRTNSNTSYEVGFYKMRIVNAKGDNVIYGQFHIVLKKEDGTWKIAQDWDTTMINGEIITKEDFEKNRPLTFK